MQTITTKPATAAEAILAIDLGKYKSVACLYEAADDVRFLPVPHQSGRAPRLPSRRAEQELATFSGM